MIVMKKQSIDPDAKQEAMLLKSIFESKKKALCLTQEKLSLALGGVGQSMAGNYLNGIRRLNIKTAIIFARELECSISDFSPRIAAELSGVPEATAKQGQEYAAIFDRLSPDGKRAAVAQLRELARVLGVQSTE